MREGLQSSVRQTKKDELSYGAAPNLGTAIEMPNTNNQMGNVILNHTIANGSLAADSIGLELQGKFEFPADDKLSPSSSSPAS